MKSKLLIGFLASASLFTAGLFMNYSVSATPPSSPMPSRQASNSESDFSLSHIASKPSYRISVSQDSYGGLFVNITRPGLLINNDPYYMNEAMESLHRWIDEEVNHVTITFFSPLQDEEDIPHIEYIGLSLPVQEVLQILP